MKKINIETIVKAAMTAPTGDNCQPFSFEWDTTHLKIFHSPKIGEHFMNINFSSSMIAFGCMIELIKISAQAQGLSAHFEIMNHLELKSQNLWGIITFTDSSILNEELERYIHIRFTDRNSYSKGLISNEEINALKLLTLKNVNSNWKFKMGPFQTIPSFIYKSESLLWVHKKAVQDFITHVHFSKKNYFKFKTGFYWQELGIQPLDIIPLSLFKFRPNLAPILWPIGLKNKIESVLKNNLTSSTGLICFFVKDFNNTSLIDVGRQSILIWLKLQQLGFSVQPMTTLTLPYYCAKRSWLNSEIKNELKNHFNNTFHEVQHFFDLDPNELPVWSLRFGRPNKKLTTRTTQRKSVDQVLCITQNGNFNS